MAQASADKIRLEVVTPGGMVVSDWVDEVTMPGVEGEFGVLPGHVPLLTALKMGEMTYRKGGETHFLAVFWGYVEVTSHKVMVLAETAEKAVDIDMDRAEIARKEAERILVSGKEDESYEVAKVRLEKAMIRQQVATRISKV